MAREMQRIYDIGRVKRHKELAERFSFPFPNLNYLLNGGIMDRVTMITSATDNGKTTLASQILCGVIKQGYKVCAFLGEDSSREAQERMFRQVTPFDEMEYVPYVVNGKQTNMGEYFLTDAAFDRANGFFSGKLFLYNTLAGSSVDAILEGFEEARTEHGCRVFLLDNVEQFDFSTENENKALKDIVIKIRDYAITKKVHIFLVAHMRKTERDVLLPDLNDVKGTSAMVNISKNVLVLIRTDKLDKSTKAYDNLKGLLRLNNYDLEQADAVLKVAKTKGRKLGFCCLKYNARTNTYTEIPKLDEAAEETEKAVVVPENVQLDFVEGERDELFD